MSGDHARWTLQVRSHSLRCGAQLRRKLLDESGGDGGSTDGSITHAHQKEIADIQAACERLEAARIEFGEGVHDLHVELLDSPLKPLPGLVHRTVRHHGRRDIFRRWLMTQIDRTVDQRSRVLRVLFDVTHKRFPAMAGLH